jgi:hypothetical protein
MSTSKFIFPEMERPFCNLKKEFVDAEAPACKSFRPSEAFLLTIEDGGKVA